MNESEVTREILGNVPSWLVWMFYVLAFGACAGAAVALVRRSRGRHHARRRAEQPPPPYVRLKSIAGYLVFHKQLRRDRFAGIAHLLTVYGFIILILGTTIVFLEHQTPLHFFFGGFYRLASLIIDLGWADRERQVGQTGKTVAPALYLACGISGASHHLAGMSDAEHVVAINSDPNAPIFQTANLGLVADIHDVLFHLETHLTQDAEGAR